MITNIMLVQPIRFPLLKAEIILKFLSSERLYLNSTRICRNAII